MTALLLLIGLFFVGGWIVAIVFAIREDRRDYLAKKNGHQASHV